MLWLFGQTWIWIVIAFILGLIIGYLVSWFFRKKQVDVTEERVAAPAAKPARERDLGDDINLKADADADVDTGVDTGSGLGLAAGGAALGGAAGFAGGKLGGDVDAPSVDAPSVDADAPSVDVDAPSVDADVDTPALADGDRTEFIRPDVDAPSVDADLDTPDVDADVDAPALSASEPTQVLSPPSLDADVDAPSVDADVDVDAPSVDANTPALSMIDAPSVDADVDAPSVDANVDAPSVDADVDGPSVDADVDAPSVDADVDAPSVDAGAGGVQVAAYGAASALPLAGGAAPSDEFTVKGNEDSMLFHTTDSPYYGRTKAEVWFKTPADAEAAGFTAWNRPKAGAGDAPEAAVAAPAPVVEAGAYPGSALPLADGAAPSEEYTVKGNEDSMLYHTTASAFYEHTRAEVWFKTPGEAEAAGFTAWNELRRGDSPTPEAAPVAAAAPAAAADTGAIGGGTVLGTADPEPDTGRIPVQAAEGVASTDGNSSPYGTNSALPLAGGAAPSADYTVKGNADSMLFHTTESPYYPRTIAEVWFKSPADAEAAGFTAWNQRRGTAQALAEPTWEPGAYPNSAQPLADGSAPAGEFTVKGNEDSMLFHTTESPYYPRTRAEVWFKTAADAEAAGFTAWNRRR